MSPLARALHGDLEVGQRREDDAPLARVVTDNLRFDGFEVEHAADGPEAIDKARTFAPDLIQVLAPNAATLNSPPA